MNVQEALVQITDRAAKAAEYIAFVGSIERTIIATVVCAAVGISFVTLIYLVYISGKE